MSALPDKVTASKNQQAEENPHVQQFPDENTVSGSLINHGQMLKRQMSRARNGKRFSPELKRAAAVGTCPWTGAAVTWVTYSSAGQLVYPACRGAYSTKPHLALTQLHAGWFQTGSWHPAHCTEGQVSVTQGSLSCLGVRRTAVGMKKVELLAGEKGIYLSFSKKYV